MKYALFSLALLLAGCGGAMPDIRPLRPAHSVEISPFASTYAAGKAHLLANRAGLAVVMLEKALAIDPLSVAALNALGTAYDELHRPEVAKAYYIKALAIEPDSADTLNNMAVSAAIAGDMAAARSLFARAVGIDPGNSMIRDNVQHAAMPPQDRVARLPEVDPNRPRLERTGLSEFTLTIPTSIVETRTKPVPTGHLSPPSTTVVPRTSVIPGRGA